MNKSAILAVAVFLTLTSCSSDKSLKIAATPVPHSDLLESVRSDLADQGVELKIVEVDDYNIPNRLLDEGQVDANFFQHEPYLKLQNKQFGYHLVPLTKVHLEPLGIYSKRLKELSTLPQGAKVAIPNDPTNESRALKLLDDTDLITLKDPQKALLTPLDISENPKNLKFEEVDAAFLPRVLPDVDLAIIPANYALQAKLNPQKDALALEADDSPYANIVVIREGEEKREELIKLKRALTSEKLRSHIEETYKGAIIPAF